MSEARADPAGWSGHLARPDVGASRAETGSADFRARLAPKASLASKVFRGWLARRETVAIREMLDPRETKGRVEWLGRMDHLVWLEYPGKWDHAVFLDLGALMAYLALLAFLGLRVPQDQRGMRVLLGLQGHLVRPGTKDQWGHQVRLAHLVLRDRLDQEESLVFLACQEQMDCQGRTETLGVQAPRETRDPRVIRAP